MQHWKNEHNTISFGKDSDFCIKFSTTCTFCNYNLKAITTLARILVEGHKQMYGKRNNAADAHYYLDVPVSFMN